MLILDGFDEVAGQLADSHQPFYVILDELLKFPNLIITTRDYQTPPPQYAFDRRLVNVGFTDAQISAYIQSYCAFSVNTHAQPGQRKEKEEKYETATPETESKLSGASAAEQAKRLEAALKENPRFWGLAHIPLNLALICESWSSATQTAYLRPLYPTSSVALESTSGSPAKACRRKRRTAKPSPTTEACGTQRHNAVPECIALFSQTRCAETRAILNPADLGSLKRILCLGIAQPGRDCLAGHAGTAANFRLLTLE